MNPQALAVACGSLPLAIEPGWFRSFAAAVRSGAEFGAAEPPSGGQASEPRLAVIRVVGAMFKGFDWPGVVVNTAAVTAAVRAARRNPDVGAVLMVYDSPGGSVAGVDDLAREVAETAAEKTVIAYADDLMASAAYWAASGSTSIYAGRSALVGSIGALGVVADTSKFYEDAGIRIMVFRSDGAESKAPGTEGEPVTAETEAAIREIVNHYGSMFVAGVAKNRGFTAAQMAKAQGGGRIMPSAEAKSIGLIDHVGTLDQAVAAAAKAAAKHRPAKAGATTRTALARLTLARARL